MKSTLLLTAAALLAAAIPAHAESRDMPGNALQGRELAVKECSQCHLVSRAARAAGHAGVGPAFADIADSASITPTSLFVFLHSSHPPMPDIILSKQESADVIAYIMSLKRSPL